MSGRSRTVRKLAAEELFQYAATLLARRAMSAGEMRTKLTRRAADSGDVEPAMTRLREIGFVDDERFAEGYATARRDSGAFGRARVARDLRQRRVSGTVTEKTVAAVFENVDESDAVGAWLERKYRGKNLAEHFQDPKNLASAYRKLRYAGFGGGAAITVLKRYASRADELEDDNEE